MPIPRAPRWSLTRDCAFAATGLDGAIGMRGGGALYSRIGVLAWYGPGFFGMARGTPRGMVMDCRVLCVLTRRFLGRKHVRELPGEALTTAVLLYGPLSLLLSISL